MLNHLIKLLGFIHLLVDQPFYLSEIMNFFKSLRRKCREIPTFISVKISSLQKRIFYRSTLKLLLRCLCQTSQRMLKDIF